MKIRNGFVSNSSSSSFCILGVPSYKIKGFNDFIADNYEGDFWVFQEELGEKLKGSNLEFQQGISDYQDEMIIGFDMSSLKDNTTIYEQKVQIASNVNQVLDSIDFPGERIGVEDIDFHIDGGYEG